MNLPLNLVVATDKNNGIGNNNQLPWPKNKDDMSWFKKITSTVQDYKKQNVVIMGRKTWESMNKYFLKERWNIILSRSFNNKTEFHEDDGPELSKCNSIESALDEIEKYKKYVENIFVIGGEEIYRQALKMSQCQKIYLTLFKQKYECDTFFPFIGQEEYHLKKLLFQNETIDIMELIRGGSTTEKDYLDILENILDNGNDRPDRTGVGTLSLFGKQIRHKFQNGSIPLLTTKRVFWKGIVTELLWFMRGSTNVKELQDEGVHIWDGNSTREFLDSVGLIERAEGDVGPTYGFNFRHFGAQYKDCYSDYSGHGVDQVAEVIRQIKDGGTSRRMIINLWNPTVLKDMALPPCLFCYQFYVANGELSCMTTQRSGDMGLGVPFNLASASLLTYMIATICGLGVGELVHNIGDAHIYKNHVEALRKQIARNPRIFPRLIINKDKNYEKVEDFEASDFMIEGYHPYPGIKMEMAV